MDITLGSLILFILIIIPGIVYRRFFFTGEFSKQYDHFTSVLKLIYVSLIAGIFIQLITTYIAQKFFKYNISFKKIFIIIKNLTDSNVSLGKETGDFLDNGFNDFLAYYFIAVFLAIIFGLTLNKSIQFFDLDKKIKILRYKNQWYYILKGGILKFQKFKDIVNYPVDINKINTNEPLLTYANLLVKLSDNKTCLYSGFVIDYELKPKSITELERLYLISAEKKPNHDLNISTETKKGNKSIPGNFLIVPSKDIINYNFIYIPSLEHIKKQEKRKQNLLALIYFFISMVAIISILIQILYAIKPFNNFLQEYYFYKYKFIDKVFITIIFIQILYLFSPAYSNKLKKFYYSKEVIIANIFFILLMIVLWFIIWIIF